LRCGETTQPFLKKELNMSNIVPIDFNAVPAFAKNKSAIAKALDDTLNSGIKRLSIKGGTFRYIAGGQEIGKIEDRFIDLVLVNAAPHVSRTLYLKQYDKDAKPEAPDCWSVDGVTPDPKAKAKQFDNCLNCPKNQKGSGQGESRACRYNQRLAVVLANDIGGEVLQLQLPATSLFGDGSKDAGATLQGYYKALAARSIDPCALITRAKFDTDVESPKLGFTAMGWLTQEQYDTAVRQGQSEAAIRAITMTVFEADGVDAGGAVPLPSGTPPVMQTPAPSAIQKAAGKAKAEPAPAAKEPAVEPAEPAEPVVRKATDVQKAPNDKIAALVQEWADDDA
jgi:hypothetical protein